MTSPSPGRLMRRPEVKREISLSCSTIHRMMEEGTFRRPRRISARGSMGNERDRGLVIGLIETGRSG